MTEALAEPQRFAFSPLSPREAHGRRDLVAVDVREPAELAGELGRIPGVTHIPLAMLLSVGPPDDWALDTPLLMVCRSGGRSAHAAMELARRGFTQIYNLSGGMLAWNVAGLPVTR